LPVKPPAKSIEHFLVPKHVLLSKEQAAELLKKYNLTLEQLPKIQASDQAIVDMKPEKDDIVKIVRNSPTAGKSIYYRKVE
jgi:DNA-directed RNA polymerase subunit H